MFDQILVSRVEAFLEAIHRRGFDRFELLVRFALAVMDGGVHALGEPEHRDVGDDGGRRLVALGQQVDEFDRNLHLVGRVVSFERYCRRLQIFGCHGPPFGDRP